MVEGGEVKSNHDHPKEVRGGKPLRRSEAEVRRCGQPS